MSDRAVREGGCDRCGNMDFSFMQSQGVGILVLSGDLKPGCVDDFRQALMVSLSNSERVIVNLKKVSEFDSACIRVFCKALKTSKKLKKHVIFDRDDLKRKVTRKGGACSVDCDLFGSVSCLLGQS